MSARPRQLPSITSGSPEPHLPVQAWTDGGAEQLSLLPPLKADVLPPAQSAPPAETAAGRDGTGRGRTRASRARAPAAAAGAVGGKTQPRRRRTSPSARGAPLGPTESTAAEYGPSGTRTKALRNDAVAPRRKRTQRAAPTSRHRNANAVDQSTPFPSPGAAVADVPPSRVAGLQPLDLSRDPRPDLADDAASWAALLAEAEAVETPLREVLHSLRAGGARLYRLPPSAGGRPARLQLAPRLDPRHDTAVWVSREQWEAESQAILAPHQMALVRLFRAAAARLAPAGEEPVPDPAQSGPAARSLGSARPTEGVIPESEAAAAVLSPAGLLLPGGALVALPATPPTARVVLEEARRQRIRQVWLTRSFLDALPDSKSWASESSSDWAVDPPELAPWLCARRAGEDRVEVDLICPSLDPDNNPFHRLADDPDELLRALALFARLVGIRYRRSTGATGTGLMRALHRGPHAKRLEDPQLPPPALDRASGERDLIWMRPLSETERARRWVHCLDRNGMYLGACSSLELGFGKPLLLQDGVAFEGSRPGYWHARLNGPLDQGCPPVLERDNRWHWYTTPTLELAEEWGVGFELAEAWVWPERSRWLKPWYERLRDARAAVFEDSTPAGRAVEAAVKGAYRKSIGWFDGRRTGTGAAWDREGDNMFRPDWRHQVVAKARANLLRFWAKLPADQRPFGTYIDQFYLASDEADPIAAAERVGIPLGSGLAHFKPHGSIAMPAALAAMDPYLQPKGGRSVNLVRALRHLVEEMNPTQ